MRNKQSPLWKKVIGEMPKNLQKKLDIYPGDVLGQAACQNRKSVEISMAYGQGGGNETHSHLARSCSPTRTTLGFFKTPSKKFLDF